jgi:hypothetical protein
MQCNDLFPWECSQWATTTIDLAWEQDQVLFLPRRTVCSKDGRHSISSFQS